MAGALKLRRDALFIKAEKGIIFRTRDHTFALRGATIYDTFRKLLPYLNGSLDLDMLLLHVRAENRASVGNFVSVLCERGVLLTVDLDDAKILEEPICEAYAQQIGFIEHFTDRPHARFLDFRKKRILLCGQGSAFVAAGAALLRNGLETLHTEAGADADIIRAETLRRKPHSLTGELECHRISELENYSTFDVVLYCSERPNLAQVYKLNEIARAQDFVFLPAILFRGRSFTGPMVRPEGGACWFCAMLRWSDNTAPAESEVFWRQLVTASPTPANSAEPIETAARILGNTLAMEVFTYATGVTRPESEEHILEQDTGTLEAAVRSLLVHPDCPLCMRVQMPKSVSEASARANDSGAEKDHLSTLLERWTGLMDHSFAVFGGYQDETLEQAPLRVSALALSQSAEKQGRAPILSWSITNSDEARAAALSSGVRVHAERHAAPALRLRLEDTSDRSCDVLRPAQLWGWLGKGGADATTKTALAVERLGGMRVKVPAGAVLPEFDSEGFFDPVNGGIGVGRSFAEALEDAVLSLCQRRTELRLIDGQIAAQRWTAFGKLENDGDCRYLLSAMETVGLATPTILIAEAEPSTVLALTDNGRAIDIAEAVLSTHFSRDVAIRNALTAYLAREQFRVAEIAWPARPNSCTTGHGPIRLSSVIPTLATAEGSFDRFVEQLGAEGADLLWLDITPPDIAAIATFRVIKALIAESKSARDISKRYSSTAIN